MKKITKLRICDWFLLFATAFILASGLQLEINPHGEIIWVWVHIVSGVLFTAAVFRHLHLHHIPAGVKNQSGRKGQQNKHQLLGILFALMLISGLIASCHWIGSYVHSTIGGVHGKIGFLFIIAVIVHICKKFRFYK